MSIPKALVPEIHFGTREVLCYAERPKHLPAMFADAVAANPGTSALICGDRRLTYADMDVEVSALAAGLAAQGVERGDRVALLLGNDLAFPLLVFATLRLGAVVVPLSVRDQTPGLTHALINSGAKVLITDADVAAAVPRADATPDLRARFVVGGTAAGFTGWAALRDVQAAVPEVARVDEEAPAAILYTSGTTGTPKGAMLTHLGIIHSATAYATFFDLAPRDRGALLVPFSHVTGLVACLMTTVRCRGGLIIEKEFKAPSFLRMAARERMSFTVMVPAMYNLMFVQDDPTRHDLKAWKVGGFGGAPMPEPTLKLLAEALPDLKLVNCYGATETTSPVVMMPAEHTAARRLSVGRASPGAVVRVMDAQGRECPPSEKGELWHAGAMVVPGYWNNPDATAREFQDGYWKSGDLGSKDEEGFIYVHDRIKDVINRGGDNVYSAQVEGVLMEVSGVIEAACVATPCPVLGERVHAVVVIDGTVTEERLHGHCAANLAAYQCPESYTLRTEALPRNANGKILKRALRVNVT